MKTYKVAAMVRYSGEYLEHAVCAPSMIPAVASFNGWLSYTHRISPDDIVELDITELSDDS